jgi:hypothetical protein
MHVSGCRLVEEEKGGVECASSTIHLQTRVEGPWKGVATAIELGPDVDGLVQRESGTSERQRRASSSEHGTAQQRGKASEEETFRSSCSKATRTPGPFLLQEHSHSQGSGTRETGLTATPANQTPALPSRLQHKTRRFLNRQTVRPTNARRRDRGLHYSTRPPTPFSHPAEVCRTRRHEGWPSWWRSDLANVLGHLIDKASS